MLKVEQLHIIAERTHRCSRNYGCPTCVAQLALEEIREKNETINTLIEQLASVSKELRNQIGNTAKLLFREVSV